MHTGAAETHAFALPEVLVVLELALALQFTDLLWIIAHIPSAYRDYHYSVATCTSFLPKSSPACRARSTLDLYDFILLGLLTFHCVFSFWRARSDLKNSYCELLLIFLCRPLHLEPASTDLRKESRERRLQSMKRSDYTSSLRLQHGEWSVSHKRSKCSWILQMTQHQKKDVSFGLRWLLTYILNE